MGHRYTVTEYERINALNNTIESNNQRLAKEAEKKEIEAENNKPENILFKETRKPLQDRFLYTEGKKKGEKQLCVVYEDFYKETIALMEKYYKTVTLPKMKDRIQSKTEMLEKKYGKKLSKKTLDSIKFIAMDYEFSKFSRVFSPHFSILSEVDQIQTVLSSDHAKRYIDQLKNFLDNLCGNTTLFEHFTQNTKTDTAGV